ncbi:MAG TPA: hypothetical protein DEF07_09485 [Nitrosomonas sp.]|nr:MAG: hypothetical protein NMNS02_19640 [Nitrosomonas sp.]HBV21934.1 hypothetical protein [Nitrosomonas sp.]
MWNRNEYDGAIILRLQGLFKKIKSIMGKDLLSIEKINALIVNECTGSRIGLSNNKQKLP